ncbi:hypothetical protein BGZ76_004124 [Entomortierella beljakovae]|nr:hypothetical protein BGZ76_004124 [Entomortierella beljakovae]
MSLDFSPVDRSPDLNVAIEGLQKMINSSIKTFYTTYAPYLGLATSVQLIEKYVDVLPISSLRNCCRLVKEALDNVTDENDPLYGVKGIYLLANEYDAFSNEYLNPGDHSPWNKIQNGADSLLKGFWAAVKSLLQPHMIQKCFITGVSPMCMADFTSGFNSATFVSWDEKLSGLCGLTKLDVIAALTGIANLKQHNDDFVQTHLEIIQSYYNGYNFVEQGSAMNVLNTNTCLEYLQGLMRNNPIDPMAVCNSEVSEPTLLVLAASPVASEIITGSLGECISPLGNQGYPLIPYGQLRLTFQQSDLAKDIKTSKSSWLSYMVHIGGLTFYREEGVKYLRIPNHIAAERFGNAMLSRLGLRLSDVRLAFNNIVRTGTIGQALSLYRQLICKCDVHQNDFKKTEEQHRDSFYTAIVGNSLPFFLDVDIEFEITKASASGGRIDMIIKVPSANRILVLEWKVVQLSYLDVGPPTNDQKSKAELVRDMGTPTSVANIKFTSRDNWRPGKTIEDWICNGDRNGKIPRVQLADYMKSLEITKLREKFDVVVGYLVVVVGSRQVLFWKLNEDMISLDHPQLAI